MSNIGSIQAVYQDFGRGDVPAILARFAEDISWDEWVSPGRAQEVLAYLAPRHGRANIAEFFAAVAASLEFHSFEPIGFFEGPDHVVSRIRFDVTLRATGKRIQDEEIHLWRFDSAGKVVEFRHYFDTLKHVEAARP